MVEIDDGAWPEKEPTVGDRRRKEEEDRWMEERGDLGVEERRV